MKLRLTKVEVGGKIDQNNVLDGINKPIFDSVVGAASFQCDCKERLALSKSHHKLIYRQLATTSV